MSKTVSKVNVKTKRDNLLREQRGGENKKYLIDFLAIIISFIALWNSYSQYNATKLDTVESIYKDYLELCIDNEKLSGLANVNSQQDFDNYFKDPLELNKYEYFVSYMLYTSEEILKEAKGDVKWRNTIKTQVSYHFFYLNRVISEIESDQIYDAELINLIKSTLECFKEDGTQIDEFIEIGTN